jgi:hypothetical protein
LNNKRHLLVYLCGPYSGQTEKNIFQARETAKQIWEAGFTAVTPHLNTYNFHLDCKCTYQDYIEGDLEILSRCDYLLLLPGWEHSQGAKIELEKAKQMGMPIFLNIDDLKDGWDRKLSFV